MLDITRALATRFPSFAPLPSDDDLSDLASAWSFAQFETFVNDKIERLTVHALRPGGYLNLRIENRFVTEAVIARVAVTEMHRVARAQDVPRGVLQELVLVGDDGGVDLAPVKSPWAMEVALTNTMPSPSSGVFRSLHLGCTKELAMYQPSNAPTVRRRFIFGGPAELKELVTG